MKESVVQASKIGIRKHFLIWFAFVGGSFKTYCKRFVTTSFGKEGS